MDQEAWEQLIDELFLDPDFRKRSKKNKSNRSKQRYTSFHGSKSYAQRRHMEGTGGIEVFKETHFKVGKGWANEIAESDYEMMQEEFKKSTQESGDSSSVNQIECMERVLGQRRGHIRGVGRVVRHLTPDVSQTYPSRGEWQNQLDERVEQLQQQLQEQQQRDRERDRAMEEMSRQMEEMRRLWERSQRRDP
ncbi:hypothetical protein R6Q59_024996 [Mikania micrantha]